MRAYLRAFLTIAALAIGGLALVAAAPPPPPSGAVLIASGTLPASAVSAREALPSANASAAFAMFINDGAAEVFFILGDSSVVATSNSFPLPAGACVSAYVGGSTHVAAITAGGSSTLRIIQANGPPQYSCGAAASGGSTTIGPSVVLAAGDTKSNTSVTATTTSGSPNLAVSSGIFAAGDVGMNIVVIPGAASAPTDQPLASTIASFTDSSHVVLADNFPYSLAGAAVWVRWGHPDDARLNAAVASSGWAQLKCGNYGVTSGWTLPGGNVNLKIEGCGNGGPNGSGSGIYALAAVPYVVGHGTTSTRGSILRDVMVDGSKLATVVCNFAAIRAYHFDNVSCNNAAPATVSATSADWKFDGTTNSAYENVALGLYHENHEAIYAGGTDLPAKNIDLEGSTDNFFFGTVVKNAHTTNIDVAANSNNTQFFGAHPYGYSPSNLSSYAATTGFNSGSISLAVGLTIDTTGLTDGWIANANGSLLIGGLTEYLTGVGNTSNGAHIPTGISNSVVLGFDTQGQTSRATGVVWDSTRQNTTFASLNPGAWQIRSDVGYQNTPGSAGGSCSGRFVTCSGTDSTASGNGNVIQSSFSTGSGHLTADYGLGEQVYSGGSRSGTAWGTDQFRNKVLFGTTTDGTTTVNLTADGGAAVASNQFAIPAKGSLRCDVRMAAHNAANGDAGSWTGSALATRNNTGNVTLVGAPVFTVEYISAGIAALAAPTFVADTAHQALGFGVVGLPATTLAWDAYSHCGDLVN